ncbi:MAG: methylenetetrahydrofolate reductase [NAD(P)H] [Planctomycetota bacterium]|nr:methylenetetrahydrofolate reductase [NAD(P)H] [Planctomycetota bacterium]
MRFSEIYSAEDSPVISFEVFPPKSGRGMESLREVLPSLVALGPRFMTVTYGAMGTTRIRTVEIASMIHNEFELECACHLTCVGAHSDQIDAQLDHIHRHGIENIVALRGDPPRGQDSFQAVKGGFSYANELVEYIRSRGGFDIAVGGYPEKHVEAPDMETDLSNLARKVESGADVVITQLFYDNECFFRFLEEVRKRGITCPVIPGLLPIHSQAQVEKIAGLCGAEIPAELQRRLEAAGTDPDAAAEVGVDWCIEQCSGLLEAGVEGIHYYVLNKARVMEKVMAGLRARKLLI